ncbi:hypothetical protein FH972_021083 [Carpinus fangiana]|uniref:tRNA(Ser) (uridine(44)-2'-O)-methyltransferase n=1 Tax=Carpinus fangiana TaxID=176857 RepID=A0A5N6KNH9_9ROSI|nr:hypothetical protein FH972_021083 [Carpinus fangiana]
MAKNDPKATATLLRPGSKFELDDTRRGADSPFTVIAHDFKTGLSTKAPFPPELFEAVMLNLIQNPNITSSYLFRADIFYDSINDSSYQPFVGRQNDHGELSSFVKHMKAEYQPLQVEVPGWTLQRTIVRQLIPRNPKLDNPMVQTCHFLASIAASERQMLVLYLPHVEKSEHMPFYHPEVRGIGFMYSWNEEIDAASTAPGTFSIHASCFGTITDLESPDSRLSRTLLRLLQTTYKHAVGLQNGYQKRVHHDQIVPQRRFQDTYTRLKGTYAKPLVENWQEVTDPSKHVFEDLGIAAFLIELWKDMYTAKGLPFPGFVDIGCGNGLLVHVLKTEGYAGWGFDVRKRKSWDTYPKNVKESLRELILVPSIFQSASNISEETAETADWKYHDGLFPPGTFVISNHADELTAWTPILARLSRCPWMAIPCCSHNLAGERFRAPVKACAEAASILEGIPLGKSQKRVTEQQEETDANSKQGKGAALDTVSLSSMQGEHSVTMLVEQELHQSVTIAAFNWIQRAQRIAIIITCRGEAKLRPVAATARQQPGQLPTETSVTHANISIPTFSAIHSHGLPFQGWHSTKMADPHEDDRETPTLALTPLADETPAQAVTRQRTLLPGPLASAVSFVTATSSLSLRVGGLISSAAINGAKITTLTSFELGRAVLEVVLARAGQDVVETSTGRIGRAAAESLLQKSLASLHYAITQTSFLVSAGFQLGTTSLSASLAVGQYLLSTLEAIFGDNETSKAIATIIVLVQREIGSPDYVGVKGERLSTADIITGVAAFALLQRWSRQKTAEEHEQLGTSDAIWDIVVLADPDTQIMALAPNANDSLPVQPGRNGEPAQDHRPRSSASFMSALNGGRSFEGFANDDSRSFMSVASSRRQLEPSSEGYPEQAFRDHLSGQLKPGASVKVTVHSMTINSVSVEIQGDNSALLEPPAGYMLVSADESDVNHRKLVFQSQRKRRKSGNFEVGDQDLFQPLRSLSQLPDLSISPPQLNRDFEELPQASTSEQSPEEVPLPPTPPHDSSPAIMLEKYTTTPEAPRANQKRQRSYFSSPPSGPVDGSFSKQSQIRQPSEPRKQGIRESLKSRASYKNLVDLFNNGQPRKRATDNSRDENIPTISEQQSQMPKSVSSLGPVKKPLSAASQMQRPISPMAAMRRHPAAPSNMQNAGRGGIPGRTSSRATEYHVRARTNPHKRPTSSIYSIATSETSVVLHSGINGIRDEPLSRTLNRDGRVPGQFPQMSFAKNAARFCRFSLASYGSSFLRIIGATADAKPHVTDFNSDDHYEHQAFTSYTRLPPSTVLLSSFVDPQGVPAIAGQSQAGTVLVHFVSLDHEAKAVILSCRGTLGFEDILTDLTADYENFEWQGKSYRVHQGMLAAARKLLNSQGGRVIATIRAALEEFPDYGLVLCGHSLGGGVASVLAIILAQPNGNKLFGDSAFVTSLQPERMKEIANGDLGQTVVPDFTLPPGRPIHVYAYGPAASVSPDLQQATKGLITSIVHGNDAVPFLSLGTLRDFQHIALAFKTDTRDAKGEVRKRVWEGLRQAIKDRAGFGERSGLFGDAWMRHDLEQANDEWPWTCLQSLRAGLQAQKVVPAGNVFHIEAKPVLQRHAFVHSDGTKEEADRCFKPATHITVSHIEDVERAFRELDFRASMFLDHVPLRYERVLDKLEKGLPK